ncbi:hypothetical protein HZA75_01920 [Candidatus Roizmanbacteria bacterium]|nr:hypothetical protein [Candidatus Roizmanbacteria bacterium]
MKLFRVVIFFLVLLFGYLALIAYPYFFSKISLYNSLGALSLVEEKSEHIKESGSARKSLLAGEKIIGEIKSSENNFGVLLFRFAQPSGNSTDTVVFRIKEKGKENWYYEKNYETNQFQPDQYFTLGFPPFKNSRDKIYVFEMKSLSGTYKNGIRMSLKEPHVAMVYQYSRSDLSNLDTLLSFIAKKFIYIVRNANFLQDWQILLIFVLPLVLILFIQSEKITITTVAKSSLILKGRKKYRFLQHSINLYSLQEKRIGLFIGRTNLWISSTMFYKVFFNTVSKKRLIIGLTLFLLAFLFRFAASIVDQSNLYPFHGSLGNGVGVNAFYSLLGNGGDYDQFIRAATCAIKSFCPSILGQNLLIESFILGMFYELFGFVGGLKAYLYLMIILSSVIATLPYFLLSRKNTFTIGGVIGSLFLATSDYLTHMAINLPPDNGSLFLFSMFFVVYLLTMQYGTIRWLLFFGLMGTIDGLNKLTMLINDLAAFLLFVPVFFFDKAKKIDRFPFVKFSPKLILYSLLPLLVFIVIYSAWEYIVQIKFSTSYYLRTMIESGFIYASRTDVASDSINIFSKGILEIVYYYIGLAIVMQKRIIDYANLNIIFLAPIFIGLLFFTFQKAKFFVIKLLSISLFLAGAFTLLVLFRNNYLGIQEVGMHVDAWPNSHYINVFLFSGILFLFFVNLKYSAVRLIIPILSYYIMLIILTKNAPWGRMWAHVITWSVVLLCFLLDWILNKTKEDFSVRRVWIGPVLLVLFVFFYIFPKISGMYMQLQSGIINTKEKVTYLRWVNSELPENAIILAGGKSDLVVVAENINKPVIYNTRWTGALLIEPKEIPGVTPRDFSIVEELKNKDNFEKYKYLILEDDIYLWHQRVKGVSDTLFSTSSAKLLNTGDYILTVYKFSHDFNKGIYELKLKNTGI